MDDVHGWPSGSGVAHVAPGAHVNPTAHSMEPHAAPSAARGWQPTAGLMQNWSGVHDIGAHGGRSTHVPSQSPLAQMKSRSSQAAPRGLAPGKTSPHTASRPNLGSKTA